jgi:hypothetical protein
LVHFSVFGIIDQEKSGNPVSGGRRRRQIWRTMRELLRFARRRLWFRVETFKPTLWKVLSLLFKKGCPGSWRSNPWFNSFVLHFAQVHIYACSTYVCR